MTSSHIHSHSMFRKVEYPQLKDGGVYADWAGSALTPRSLLEAQQRLLMNHVLGNPHSKHSPSVLSTQLVEQARERIIKELGAFDVPGDEYDVIFTSNATGAILLLNHMEWHGGSLLMLEDNHNSVNGLRVKAQRDMGMVSYSPITASLEVNGEALAHLLAKKRTCRGPNVFAYPLKSNYTGIIHGLAWAKMAQEYGWKVLVDASSYLPNQVLSLKGAGIFPDYIAMSFYKIFGYPAGLGALLVRRSALEPMKKQWFSGGSIMIVSVGRDFYVPELNGHARYEDGTQPFMSIPLVFDGFDFITHARNHFPAHAHEHASELRERLAEIPRGKRHIQIHTPAGKVSDTVAFNVYEGKEVMDPEAIERLANERNIWIRSGCLCNPGCNEKIFGYTTEAAEQEIAAGRANPQRWEEISVMISPTFLGTLRASFGLPNNSGDVDRIANFFEDLVVGRESP
jgi:selenocysteine lyase/cysteine desulfurase